MEEWPQFDYLGEDFTKHLKRRGGCTVYIAGNLTGGPKHKGKDIRRMLVDVPAGWRLRAGCFQRNCIEPEHMEISPNTSFADSYAPVQLTPPMHRVRSYKQFEKEFLEV